MTNAAKHSGASAITVTVERDRANGALRLKIADNGVGGAEFTGGTGLLGIKDRVEALGGHMDLHSPRGAGTDLRVTLPLTQANGDTLGASPAQPTAGPSRGSLAGGHLPWRSAFAFPMSVRRSCLLMR